MSEEKTLLELVDEIVKMPPQPSLMDKIKGNISYTKVIATVISVLGISIIVCCNANILIDRSQKNLENLIAQFTSPFAIFFENPTPTIYQNTTPSKIPEPTSTYTLEPILTCIPELPTSTLVPASPTYVQVQPTPTVVSVTDVSEYKYSAPQIISPAPWEYFRDPHDRIVFEWEPVGTLGENEYYEMSISRGHWVSYPGYLGWGGDCTLLRTKDSSIIKPGNFEGYWPSQACAISFSNVYKWEIKVVEVQNDEVIKELSPANNSIFQWKD